MCNIDNYCYISTMSQTNSNSFEDDHFFRETPDSPYGKTRHKTPGGYDLIRNVHRITLYNTVASSHQHTSNRKRLYLHLDMNCFYAQVEQQCYGLFGMPVIVGGWRKENGIARGIVATSSYEARKLGIKTAMSAYEAASICPYLIFMQVHYDKYRAISREIRNILDRYSPEVEGYSMDEYFLDITHMLKSSHQEIIRFGAAVKNEIRQKTKLVASVGIARSKTWSKLASDIRKPNGLTAILTPDDAAQYLYPLSLDEVWGIGCRRFEKLRQEGVTTVAEALRRGPLVFQRLFGQYFGKMLFETVAGRDQAKVEDDPLHVPEEVTYMHTFSDWTKEPDRVKGEIIRSVQQLCYRMRGYNRRARCFKAYIRFQDAGWKGVSQIFSTPGYTNIDEYVLKACLECTMPVVHHFLRQGQAIRGFGLNTLELDASQQLELFFREGENQRNLCTAVDVLNNRFGIECVRNAGGLHAVEGKTHFLDR